MTRKEARLKSLKVAENLTKLGFKKGDTISIIANHHGDLAPLIFGSIATGVIVNTLHNGFSSSNFYTHRFIGIRIINIFQIFFEFR